MAIFGLFKKKKKEEEPKIFDAKPEYKAFSGPPPKAGVPDTAPPVQKTLQVPRTDFSKPGAVTTTDENGNIKTWTKEEWTTMQKTLKGLPTVTEGEVSKEVERKRKDWDIKDPTNEEKRIMQENANIAGGIGQLTPEQLARENAPGLNPVGVGSAIGGGLKGAAAGGTAGAAVGALFPPAMPFTAAGGAIGGGAFGLLAKISSDKKQNVKEAYTVANTANSNIIKIINWANSGKISASQAVEMFNEEETNLLIAEKNIKRLNDGDIDKFTGQGGEEAAKIEGMIRLMDSKKAMLYDAIVQPNPNKVIPELNYYAEEIE